MLSFIATFDRHCVCGGTVRHNTMTTLTILIIIAGITAFVIWNLKKPIREMKSMSIEEFRLEQYSKAKEQGISKLSEDLQNQLSKVIPSKDGIMEYKPCRVTLKSGEVYDNVYLSEIKVYLEVWGLLPISDTAKKSIIVKDILKIEESPNRLPPELATKIYNAGESGMGYVIFALKMRDGNRIPFQTGNAVDFITLPDNYSTKDIEDVLPHKGRNENPKPGPAYYWCLYEN